MTVSYTHLVTFVLVLINGYFSMSEMALVNVRHVLLQKDADEGDQSARRALDLASDSGQLLATIQVAITLVGFFASAAAATNLSEPFASWLSGFGIGWLSFAAPALAPVLITLAVSYLSIVVGELVPKRIALADACLLYTSRRLLSRAQRVPPYASDRRCGCVRWLTAACAGV